MPTCNRQKRIVQRCVTIPDGKYDCRDRTYEKTIRITKTVCDQSRVVPNCYQVSVAECQEFETPNCRMVPRQVCQPTCSKSNFCNQCSEFANNPGSGFGNCQTSTCPNYYGPSGPTFVVNNQTMNQDGLLQTYGLSQLKADPIVDDILH